MVPSSRSGAERGSPAPHRAEDVVEHRGDHGAPRPILSARSRECLCFGCQGAAGTGALVSGRNVGPKAAGTSGPDVVGSRQPCSPDQ